MSSSFFQSIRRNQRQWMVVVTALAMVSFLFLDNLGRSRGALSPLNGAMIIGCLGAAALCIVGMGRQKAMEYGVGGFIVGALVGFISFGALAQSKPVARTNIGNLTHEDFNQMKLKRQRVNQFFAALSRHIPGVQMGFGNTDNESLVSHRLLLADAQKMGIRISDEGITEFLKEVTNNRLTKEDFHEALVEARIGETELYDILKEELSVLQAIKLIFPPATIVNIPPGLERFASTREPLRYMQQTPLQVWDSFQMLNQSESLQAAAIPVSDFVSEVGQPSDSELAEFFLKYKSFPWRDEARPGFLHMPRVKLAYFSADFESFEKGEDPTDEEIREYYEKNKDRYIAPPAKESTAPKLPDEVANEPGDDAADALKPETSAPAAEPETSKAPETEKKTEEPAAPANPTPEPEKQPEPEKKPDADEKPKAEPAVEEKKPSDSKSDSSCGEEPAAEKTADAVATQVEPKPEAEAKPAETPAEKAPEKPAGSNVNPPADKAPASEKLENEAGTSKDDSAEQPPAPDSPHGKGPVKITAPKIRELDDDLKLEIRDAILRERTFAKIGAALDLALDQMAPFEFEYNIQSDDAQKKKVAKSISDKMKEYAILHQLQYVETGELEYEQLSIEPIGTALDSKSRAIVANEVFMRDERGESRLPLYTPRRADPRNKRGGFAYWKIDYVPERQPELTEADVKEKVIRAWKFDQARLLAEKRAKALADKAKAEKSDLTAAIAGESASGQKTDPELRIIETPPFTWLSTPDNVPPGRMIDPMPTDIPLIPDAGNDFMKVVFEDLNDGEIGVASNVNRSVYYVVKVIGRDSAKDDGGVSEQARHKTFLSQNLTGMYPFSKSPYESIAQFAQREIDQAWRVNMAKKHSVEWGDESEQPRSRR